MKIITLILLITFLFACSTDRSPLNTELDYVQGEVAFGLIDSITLLELADYIYSLSNISIKQVSSFQYYTNLPQDSMQIIKSALESKSYVWDGMINIWYDQTSSKIMIDVWIRDFKSEDREDWELTKERFSFTHIPGNFQVGLLKVKNGREKEWIKILSNSGMFRYLEVNHFTHAS